MKKNNKLNEEEHTALIEYNDAAQKAHETITEQVFIMAKQLRAVVIVQTLLIIYLIING